MTAGTRGKAPRSSTSPARFYLVCDDTSAPLLRISETKNGDVLLWVHGLDDAVPAAAYRLPDQRFKTTDLSAHRVWRGDQLEALGAAPDHFTFHRGPSGEFHLRLHGASRTLYSDTLRVLDPISVGPDVPVLLDIEILTDRVSYYRNAVPRRKPGSIALRATPAHFFRLRCCISGAEFDIGSLVEWDVGEAHPAQGRTAWLSMQMVFKVWREVLAPDQYATRPRGTIVRLRFNAAPDEHIVKEFLFA